MGKAIGANLEEVINVDVADTGVQWGTCLRVRVAIDLTRKLIRGRKINFEEGEARCGLLEHDLKDCLESMGNNKAEEKGDLQYGAWLRGEPIRRGGLEFGFAKKKEGGKMKNRAKVQQTKKHVGSEVTNEENHEKSKEKNVVGSPKGVLANLGKENWEKQKGSGGIEVSQQGMTVTQCNVIPKFEFMQALETLTHDCHVGLGLVDSEEGLMAMSYEQDVGWVANTLGPTSGHWKRRAQDRQDDKMKEELGLI
ncbi:hypothetical protein CFP56_023794 [Quercus suber]|uniref:Uncharacterized protein n=1 Tax=Quercus suber TaxID=58331 RepID=A0AAW0K742_QUESU